MKQSRPFSLRGSKKKTPRNIKLVLNRQAIAGFQEATDPESVNRDMPNKTEEFPSHKKNKSNVQESNKTRQIFIQFGEIDPW